MNVAIIQVLLSMGLALIFFASAIPKLRHPWGFILAVLEYRVLPTGLSWVYARVLRRFLAIQISARGAIGVE